MADKVLRCAVYTRKSTEDGLEQEFNSLDAQYEACTAYALSQKHEGWLLVPGRYDDGGFSGGNMQRPGLHQLLADVAAGEIDIILVYKIDRLTRSLADFAKIVEVLDKAGASFVSITQSFNTTTSMGRLTLNMLLSFAQFEREVTSERIRDKIAASKRKGLWMGGPVPLGYEVDSRKLVVNQKEAELVQHIMERYLALGSVAQLGDELNADGLKTKVQHRSSGPHKGGCQFSRGMLYHLLANRIYIGEMVHKGESFPGEHDAIVAPLLWDAVQEKLAANASGTARRVKAKQPSLLVGLLFDGEGRAMTPSHASKSGKRYRYYVTRPDLLGGTEAWRVPADDLEQLVCDKLGDLFANQHSLCDLAGEVSGEVVKRMFAHAGTLHAELQNGTAQNKRQLLPVLIDRIALRSDGIDIALGGSKLANALGLPCDGIVHRKPVIISCTANKIRCGQQLRLVIAGPASSQSNGVPAGHVRPDDQLVKLLAEAQHAQQIVLSRPTQPTASTADGIENGRERLAKMVSLSCLAPDIIEAVLGGRQPAVLTAQMLLDVDLPMNWSEQRQCLGFG